MTGTPFRDPWVKRARWLTQALIISGTINVGLLSSLIYFAMRDGGPGAALQLHEAGLTVDRRDEKDLQTLLNKYSALSFQDLVLRLGNKQRIESGISKRDLALACLVSGHYLNLEKALGGMSPQKREIPFIRTLPLEPTTIAVFTGLGDDQYKAIESYVKTEKWPLTSQGIFEQLKASRLPYDPTLLEAFYLSLEYHYISMLFSKTGAPLKKEHLAILLSQGSWPTIQETSDFLRQNSAFTVEERRKLLLDLMKDRSRLAAKVLLETDEEFCTKDLDSSQLLLVCSLLGPKAPSSFLKTLIANPRDEESWKKAAAILYEQAAEPVPETLDLDVAKMRFLELKVAPKVVVASAAVTTPKRAAAGSSQYTVKAGDSLWKIAKSQKVSVEALRKANHIRSDNLKVGQTLVIP